MASITKELIAAHAVAAGRRAPTGERAEALAEAVRLMVRAADEAAAELTFESEPAHFSNAMNDTAAR